MINFGLLEASGVDFGSILELFLSNFGASERLWEATLEREPGGAQKVRKIANTPLEFQLFFLLRFVCFLSLLAAAAQARTLKNQVFAWRVLPFSLVRFLARSEK